MRRTEGVILAGAMESTRRLFFFYLSKIKGLDPYKTFSCDGMKLNSAHWITAHLAWAENKIILAGTYGRPVDIEWLDNFKFGSDPIVEGAPSFEEALKTLKEIHSMAVEHVRSLGDEVMDRENGAGMKLADAATVRDFIHHHIRHEGAHVGQLGWLVKLYGIKTV